MPRILPRRVRFAEAIRVARVFYRRPSANRPRGVSGAPVVAKENNIIGAAALVALVVILLLEASVIVAERGEPRQWAANQSETMWRLLGRR
jgi:hypothetical protein